MKNLILLISFLSIFLIGCRKDPDRLETHTIAEGVVTQFGTNTPVANAFVYLLECEKSCRIIDSFRSDANGRYSFDFVHKSLPRYEIGVSAKNYYNSETEIATLGYRNRFNFNITPAAWIKVKVKNVTRQYNDKYIHVWGSFSMTFFTQNLDTSFTIKGRGNQNNSIYLAITASNGMDSKLYLRETKEVYAPGLDTLTYEINF